MNFVKILPATVLAILLAMPPVLTAAATPSGQVRESVAKLLATLNDPQLKADRRERREKLKAVIHERFDFTEMAKRSLGAEWRRRTPEEQKEFVNLFTNLLERAYLTSIENVEKARFVREHVDDNYAEVKTQVGGEFPLDYRLHNVNSEWKVYDVIVDNVSFVNNSRIQFNYVLAQYSYPELLRRIHKTLSARDEIQPER